MIPEGPGVVLPSIVHLVVGFVNYLPYTGAEGCPPLPERQTIAPVVRPHYVEL